MMISIVEKRRSSDRLFLQWELPYSGKTVLVLKEGPGPLHTGGIFILKWGPGFHVLALPQPCLHVHLLAGDIAREVRYMHSGRESVVRWRAWRACGGSGRRPSLARGPCASLASPAEGETVGTVKDTIRYTQIL